jgi:hypothetical protein
MYAFIRPAILLSFTCVFSLNHLNNPMIIEPSEPPSSLPGLLISQNLDSRYKLPFRIIAQAPVDPPCSTFLLGELLQSKTAADLRKSSWLPMATVTLWGRFRMQKYNIVSFSFVLAVSKASTGLTSNKKLSQMCGYSLMATE